MKRYLAKLRRMDWLLTLAMVLLALADELGPVGMVRFLQQTETGRGDYSHERHARIRKQGVAALVRRLEARRKK